MKFQMTKYGFKGDPRDAHVTLTYQGRELLGKVVGFCRDDVCGATLLEVRYLNGEEWPIQPHVFAVDVLERTYE